MLITDKNNLIRFQASKRLWQGIPGIQTCGDRFIYVCFYSGNYKEGAGNYCALVRSADGGKHFTEPLAVAYPDEENSRFYDPCVWLDPSGKLWFFFSSMPMQKVFYTICDNPCDETPIFSEPRIIGDGVMLNKPTVTGNGTVYFPLSVWNPNLWAPFILYNNITPGAFAWASKDGGKTIRRRGAPFSDNSSYDEHIIIEMKDKSLTMLLRTPYGIGISHSFDNGNTWTDVTDSGLGGPDSRFSISRMPSGNILLVNHFNFSGRNNLYAMISDDEMKTFKGYLPIDVRNDVSYPDVSYGDDGYIYIVYDHERGGYCHSIAEAMSMQREILFAKVTEDDILAGKIVTSGSRLCMTVNKLGKYDGVTPDCFISFGETDDEFVDSLCLLSDGGEIIDKLFDEYGNKCLGLQCNERKELDAQIKEFEQMAPTIGDREKKRRIISIINILKTPIIRKKQDDGRYLVERVFTYLSSCFCESFTLEQMANQLSVSKYYLCHLFKSYTGDTIVQYRNTLRLRLAKKMLENTDVTLVEISGTCGFESISYFTECFRKYEGITPTEYRKLNRRKKKTKHESNY